ncbi:MAG: AAA family ATPase, partial [Gammaproteobacteria bacterium]|nr:AAA family ATPase [Gammaproteobacteria bacterium]
MTQHLLSDYGRLERHLAASPHHIGGLGLLEEAPVAAVQEAREVAPIVQLNDSQRSAVEATLTGRPVTVVSGPPGCGKSEVVLSILLNAWASSTSVLFASSNNQAVDVVCQRLRSFESEFEIAVRADEQPFDNIDEALTRAMDLITARRGESHYGGSLSARKHGQLTKKKQRLREMLDSGVPQRLSQAIQAALESHGAQRQALSALKSRREELAGKLRNLGVEDTPDAFGERIVDPLRKWRDGISATSRLIKKDAQREATLQRELSTALADRDSALASCQIKTPSDDASSWLLAKPGFESFEQALVALSDKLQEPIKDEFTDAAWEEAYDGWSSSEAAADWERKAREVAALLRPAGIALKEKAEEVSAAREALDSAQRAVQEAIKSSSLDVRREDVDEWAACYAELCALPRAKIAFLPQSRSAELVRQLEKVEG